jgi:dipeptidyl aminopeptidase/acylaminoacyl peptidase
MIMESGVQKRATDWAKDGTSIVYMTRTKNWELWRLPLGGDRKPLPLVQNGFNNLMASFSPDGRWFAYHSDESGRFEIYMQPVSTRGGRVQISTNGGRLARWRRDQSELFFIGPENRITSVQMKRTAAGLEPGRLTPLFAIPSVEKEDADFPVFYDVSADGQRFLIRLPTETHTQDEPMTVIVNWPARLNQVATRTH